jgi:hypothetical protein
MCYIEAESYLGDKIFSPVPDLSDTSTNYEKLDGFNFHSTSSCRYVSSVAKVKRSPQMYDEILPARVPEPCPTGIGYFFSNEMEVPKAFQITKGNICWIATLFVWTFDPSCPDLMLISRDRSMRLHLFDDLNSRQDQVVRFLHRSNITCFCTFISKNSNSDRKHQNEG